MEDKNQRGNINENDYSHKSHRKALGVPEELNNRPLLFFSSHRGVLDARYPSHVELFKRTWAGEETADEDRVYAYLDLTTVTQKQIIDYIKDFIVRDDPSRRGQWLPSDTGENDPLPGFITNIQYLPPLNNQGNTDEPSQTFAIDPHNARPILQSLRNFLEKKGILKNNSGPERLSM